MPDPQAAPLHVSPLQLDSLQHIVRRSTSAQRLVKRSRIMLLAVTGIPNTQIAKQVQVDHETVRALARPVANRRSAFAGYRSRGEAKSAGPGHRSTLDRRAAFGSAFPVHRSQQYRQMMAIACETPAEADREVECLDATRMSRRSRQTRHRHQDFSPHGGALFKR